MNQVTLSRRNLLYLLARMERGSKQPFLMVQDGSTLVVKSDAEHYKDQAPGPITPETLQVMEEIEMCLAIRRNLKEPQ